MIVLKATSMGLRMLYMGVLFILMSVKVSVYLAWSMMFQLSDPLYLDVVLLYLVGLYFLCCYDSETLMCLIYIILSLMICWDHLCDLSVLEVSLACPEPLLLSWLLGFIYKLCHNACLLVCYSFDHTCVGWS